MVSAWAQDDPAFETSRFCRAPAAQVVLLLNLQSVTLCDRFPDVNPGR